MKSDLYTYLSTVIDDSIYPDVAPLDASLPFTTFQIISSDRPHYMGGTLGVVQRRVQFDHYGNTADDVDARFEEFRDQLDALVNTTIGNLQIQAVWLDNERDGYIAPPDMSDVPRHRRTADYMIVHRETIPGTSG